jgi:hypothetical protein
MPKKLENYLQPRGIQFETQISREENNPKKSNEKHKESKNSNHN